MLPRRGWFAPQRERFVCILAVAGLILLAGKSSRAFGSALTERRWWQFRYVSAVIVARTGPEP
jgi:hypothetical protein